MYKSGNATYAGFSFFASFCFITKFVEHIYGTITRRLVSIGPDKLIDIPWMRETIIAIIVGFFVGLVFYKIEIAEKAQGKVTHIPQMKFPNFFSAILFFAALFFCFIFIFVIREYNEYSSEITYLLRETFWQYCATNIPWLEILATSLIFGIILAVGFSTTAENKSQEDKK